MLLGLLKFDWHRYSETTPKASGSLHAVFEPLFTEIESANNELTLVFSQSIYSGLG
jgi:hypothetical protein